jgi:uncharacterized protein (TIGR02453 family)
LTTAAPSFTGFRPDAIAFLAELAANNDRAWFSPRKAEYERLIKEPLEALCAALPERFAAHGVPLTADARKSPFRIYRDVRFAKDKSPYKTNAAAGFPYSDAGDDARRGAGGYFHLAPGEIYVGGGMWHPEAAWVAAWRRTVLERPGDVHAALDDPAFRAEFGELNGHERLSRPPAGVPADHPDLELLKVKDVGFGRRMSDDEAFSPDLPDTIARSFAAAVPVLRLLSSIRP